MWGHFPPVCLNRISMIPIGSPDERTAILRLWDQHQDTFNIGRLLHRAEEYIERQLHIALDRASGGQIVFG